MDRKTNKGYHKLLVWQRARELVKLVYKITENFPRVEELDFLSTADYDMLERKRSEVGYLLYRLIRSLRK